MLGGMVILSVSGNRDMPQAVTLRWRQHLRDCDSENLVVVRDEWIIRTHRLQPTHAPLQCVQNVLESVINVVEADGRAVEVKDKCHSQPVVAIIRDSSRLHLRASSVVNQPAPVIARCDVWWNPKVNLEFALRHRRVCSAA